MRSILTLCLSLCVGVVIAQKTANTYVHGVVRDSLTRKPLAYASISLDGKKQVLRSDLNGNFYVESGAERVKLRISYVGYETRTLSFQAGERHEVEVLLVERNAALLEVTIRPQKYSRKNNPAVDLVEEVFKHKDKNRMEGLDSYRFEKYETLQMDLNNITESYRKKWYFRPFRFVFNNVDTNQVTQKVAWPFYLRERLLRAYYRKDPAAQKAFLVGQRQAGFVDEDQEEDDLGISGEGVSEFLNATFSEADIYASSIELLGKAFVGPLSPIANSMYRFYIVDTVEFEGVRCADLFFAPRNKADLAFMGNMLVALDSSYAVLRAELGVPKEINLNFVSELHIEQVFDRVKDPREPLGPGKLMLRSDAVTVDLKVLKNKKNGRSLLAHKQSLYRNQEVNIPLPDSLFKTKELLQNDTGAVKKRPKAWWDERRYAPLNRAQYFVDKMLDSVKQVRAYKIVSGVGKVLGTGYKRTRFVDFGPLGNLYSYNDIEGGRLRFGGRTNTRLYRPLVLDGYVAYGLRDLLWKYNASATYSLNGKAPRTFPNHQVGVSYQKDLRTPGLAIGRFSQDNALLSVQRGVRDRMLFSSTLRLDYQQEFQNRFSYSLQGVQRSLSSAGALSFEISGDGQSAPTYAKSFNTTEIGIYLRFAPQEKFYAGANTRRTLPSRKPVFSLNFRNGFEGFAGGQYAYQKVGFSVRKRFLLAPLGNSNWRLQGGRTWGSVPYPLLDLPPANPTYFYDAQAFSLMNFFEFVSDKYVSLVVQHSLEGLILNRIPLVKKLQWREALSFKAMYGGLDRRNDPAHTAGLFAFPVDAQGASIVHRFDNRPYMEFGAGVSNVFRALRIDYIRRLSYTELPGAPKWGIRVGFSPQF